MGTLHQVVYTFVIISCWIRFNMRNVHEKVVEKITAHILCSVTFFWKSCQLWDNVENMVDPDGPQMTIWYSACALRCGLLRLQSHTKICNTGLFKMIVGVLTYCRTQYTSFCSCNPMWFLFMGLRQGSGSCSSFSRKYPETEGMNQNRHWNHHPLTCYKQFGTNSFIVLMFVESQRMRI